MYTKLVDKPSLDELVHDGVKGMKWGVRPSDPDTSDNTHHETSGERTSISVLDSNYKKAEQAYLNGVINKDGRAAARNLDAMIEANRKRREMAKKIAIGAGVGLALVGGTYVAVNHGDAIKEAYLKCIEAGRSSLAIANPEFYNDYLKHPHGGGVLTDEAILGMKTEGLELPAGQVLHRMQWDNNTAYREDGFIPRIFCSFTEDDVVRYRGVIQDFMMRPHSDTMYELTLKAQTTLKSPSQRERYEIFQRLLESDPKFRSDMCDAFGARKSVSPRVLAKAYYKTFTASLCAKHPVPEAYLKAVKDAGFNCIIDDNDAGHIAEAPLILLDTGIFSYENVTTVFRNEINAAKKAAKPVRGIVAWSNQKGLFFFYTKEKPKLSEFI